ncbi:MAG: ATP-binding cassette domain-containing protein, partial [Desulfobacula sp.]|nr:ATP-binding cassette domain-containing protein [Desulfobacula sp.]
MHLECRQLNFTYPGSDIVVIENLSFSMENPGFKALFGPSGVGKTSLAKMIADSDIVTDGQIIIQDIYSVLYSYNLERLPGWSSTGRHLKKITPGGKEALREELVDIFELKDVLKSQFSQLSMGQQNRINLIRYLLQEFDLLILDESLANVDEKLRETIILAIKELFKEKMFLYISHNLMEVSKFCDQILVFGKSMGEKKNSMISGRDYKKEYTLD